MVKNIIKKSDAAWFVKASAEYETKMESTMKDRTERLVAQIRELVSCNNFNLVTRLCYPGKRKQYLNEEEVKAGLRKMEGLTDEAEFDMRKFKTDMRKIL